MNNSQSLNINSTTKTNKNKKIKYTTKVTTNIKNYELFNIVSQNCAFEKRSSKDHP
jgi:hypothetical protein